MWIVTPLESYEIIGINIREFEDGSAELWGTKSTGKTVKLETGTAEYLKDKKLDIELSLISGLKTYDL